MAVTAHTYNNAPKHLTNGDVAFLTDTVKTALFASYTYAATHDTMADVKGAGTEATGGGSTGYTARGLTMATKTIATASNVTTLDTEDAVWTTGAGGTLAAAWAVLYKDTGTDSTSYVLGAYDFGGTNTASNGGTFTYTVPGALTLTV